MENLRLAVIGLGAIGRKYVGMLNEGVKGNTLTAVVARSDANYNWALENGGKEGKFKIFRSTEELFENDGLFDTAVIATPHRNHLETALTAFSHNKHVLCEKPTAAALSEAIKMEEAAKEAGLKLGVIFQWRAVPVMKKMKELLEQGTVGKIKRIKLENTSYFRTLKYHRSGAWRSSWKGEGGGALVNQAQHYIDLWLWLFGIPKSIFADVEFGKHSKIAVDDEVSLLMKYENGATGVFILSTGEVPKTDEISVIGTKGKITLRGNSLWVETYPDSDEYIITADCGARECIAVSEEKIDCKAPKTPQRDIFEAFAESVAADKEPAPNGKDGINAIMLANAAYISSIHQKALTLPIDPNLWDEELEKLEKAEKASP